MKTEEFKSIGRKIRYFRKQRGLTLEMLGGKAGVCPKYLGEIERGNSNPTLVTILRIARGLEKDVHELLEIRIRADEVASIERIKAIVNGKCEKKVERIIRALELLLD